MACRPAGTGEVDQATATVLAASLAHMSTYTRDSRRTSSQSPCPAPRNGVCPKKQRSKSRLTRSTALHPGAAPAAAAVRRQQRCLAPSQQLSICWLPCHHCGPREWPQLSGGGPVPIPGLLLPAGPTSCLGVAPPQQVLAPAPAPALDQHDGKVRGVLDQHIAGL